MAKTPLWKTIGVWVLTVLVALMLFGPGLSKLTEPLRWDGRFEGWGLPIALIPVVGVAELLGALLILIPVTASAGGTIIGVVMIGATLTHFLNDEIVRAPLTLVLVVIAFGIARYRRDRFVLSKTPALRPSRR